MTRGGGPLAVAAAGGAGPPALVELSAADRVLIIAAHPDDECLAASGLLQRAAAADAAIAIVYVTDGENNPWAQRAHERRILVGATDRASFGLGRRAESVASLAQLGIASSHAHFLALPDYGLTRLLIGAAGRMREVLEPHLVAWRPTLVVSPSAADLHPDHSALAVLVRLVLGACTSSNPPAELAYLVHHPAARRRLSPRFVVDLDEGRLGRKAAAIACHASQMHWRGPWLRSFATKQEAYFAVPWPQGADHPVGPLVVAGREATVAVHTHPRPRSFGARTLWLLIDRDDTLACLRAALPILPGRCEVVGASPAAPSAHATFAGGPRRGELRFPAHLLAGARRVFLKLERRFGFFDEAGWREFPLPPTNPLGGAGRPPT